MASRPASPPVTHAPHARPSVACRSRRGRAGLEAAAAGRRSSGAGRARRARDRGDPSSLLETPAPQPHMHAASGQRAKDERRRRRGARPPRTGSSDVLQMLNLPGGTQTAPGAPPRLMSIDQRDGRRRGARCPTPRSRSAIYILALLGVIGLIVVARVIYLKKPPKPAATIVQPPPVAAVEPPVAPEPPPVAPPTIAARSPSRRHRPARGKRGASRRAPAATKDQPTDRARRRRRTPTGDAARFRDTSTPEHQPSSRPRPRRGRRPRRATSRR